MAMTLQKKEAALAEYLDECQEMLERLSKNLACIENGAADTETLAAIYRDMHTIKGSSQLFGFAQIGQLAHALETCLDPVRKGSMKVSDVLVDSLYSGCDIISSLLSDIRETRAEADKSQALVALLPRLIAIAEVSITSTVPPTKDKGVPGDAPPPKTSGRDDPEPDSAPERGGDHIRIATADQKPRGEAHMGADATNAQSIEGFHLFEEPATEPGAGAAPPAPSEPHEAIHELSAAPKVKPATDDQQAETIRVHVSLLDNLMNLVGELVLIRNQLLQHAKSNDDDTEFLKMSQRLNILTAELQNEVMKTRMQPIGNILNKFTRVVRDMGRELGKKIELELHGAETELDKTIIEAVKDPLTHIVRNAVDHGIESVEERRLAGKMDTGLIRLKACHESGQVIIEIADDGRGLDRARLGGKAVEKGLITKESFAKMSDREVQNLIFAPGFSTASTLSNISGRGVGMDVVKTNVERIGGIVDVFSTTGVGTTIKLKIPLTLAIVPALLVRAGGQRFAIPQSKLVELLRIDEADGSAERIESLQGRPVLRLRGKLLPIISLAEVLSTPPQDVAPAGLAAQAGAAEPRVSNVVVLNADGLMFGLTVDGIDDSVDIVVKSLSQFLKDLTAFSGATIMGDGSVALTIDVSGIAETANLAAATADVHAGLEPSSRSTAGHHSEAVEFLVIDVGAPGSYAIPLTVVSRIEEFESARFERSGEQRVVRYRDALLPIFSLPEFLSLPFADKGVKATPVRERTPVVVIKRGDRLYGIEVRGIHDIIEVDAPLDQSVKDRPGILGSVIAQDQVIVVVDIFGMVDAVKERLEVGARADGANQPPGARPRQSLSSDRSANRRRHRILVVEDSAFFRNYIRQILQDAGYLADVACDGADGLAVLENAPPTRYSLVLSDIEMPTMDGYEFARRMRASKEFAALPIIAITTKFSAGDVEQGKAAGFTEYLEKLNAERLLAQLDKTLGSNGPEVSP